MVYKKGYYICHVTKGLIHGPRASELADGSVRNEAIRVGVSYGIPIVGKSKVSSFDQVEWNYALLRYRTKDGEIYVFRFDPRAKDPIVRVESQGFSTVKTTPALAKVFDELAPRWIAEDEAFQRKRGEAEQEAMKAAGITDADFPVDPDVDLGDPKWVAYEATSRELLARINAHYPVLEPLAIAVEGLDDIFRNVPVWRHDRQHRSRASPTELDRDPNLFVD